MKTNRVILLLALAGALAATGCANTVRGVGKDIKDTGRAVQSL